MFGSDILDVAVGLVFVYLLASLMVSSVTELLAGWLGWRADKLFDGIRNLVDSPKAEDWAKQLYEHPLIQGMSPLPTKRFWKLAPPAKGPSYIPARTFSTALLGLVQNSQPAIEQVANELQGILADTHTSAADVKAAVLRVADNVADKVQLSSPPGVLDLQIRADLQRLADKIPDGEAAAGLELVRAFVNNVWERYLAEIINQIPDKKLRTALTTLLQQTEGGLESFKKSLETWFNDAMDRVSGWYKRHTQWVQLILAVALTFALNLDTVSIVKALSKDNSGLLKTMAANADKFVERTSHNSKPASSLQPSATATPSPADPSPTPPPNNSKPLETLAELEGGFGELMLPIGWTSGPPADSLKSHDFRQWPGWPWEYKDIPTWSGNCWNVFYPHFAGWLLTVIAVSLGAPFWFDLLSKIIAIRASGDPPPEPSQSKKAGNNKNGDKNG